jgi:steroid 5-alpha reductase family enzyme
MSDMVFLLTINFCVIMAYMFFGWLMSLAREDASIADILWGVGFIIVAWVSFFLNGDSFPGRKILLVSLVTLWGVRLAVHIALRNRGKGEDPRYRAWREQYGEKFKIVSLFKVFLLQGLFLWVISLGAQYGQFHRSPWHFTAFDVIGACVWAVGFFFEALGDYQLTVFLRNGQNKGKVLDSGLWRYTRHPNYFGEATMWWGIFLVALSAENAWWTVASPLLITYSLLKVSGVTMLEAQMIKENPEYKSYIERTSSFLPWFPKKK